MSKAVPRTLVMGDSSEIWLFDVPAQYLEEEAFK